MEDKNNKNNNNFTYLIVLVFIMYFMPFMMSYMSAGIVAGTTDEVVDVVEEIEETEEEAEVEVTNEDLFVVVAKQNLDYKIMYFKPTRVMYVSYNRGDLVMLIDAYGDPLTYDEYLRLLSK